MVLSEEEVKRRSLILFLEAQETLEKAYVGSLASVNNINNIRRVVKGMLDRFVTENEMYYPRDDVGPISDLMVTYNEFYRTVSIDPVYCDKTRQDMWDGKIIS